MKTRNLIGLAFVALLAIWTSGCATGGLKQAIPGGAITQGVASGKSFIVVSKQGVMPFEQVYRPYWPDAYASASRDGASRAFPVELVVPIIGEVLDNAVEASADYNKTQRETYRYRTDVGVFNAEGLSKEALHEVLSHATRPNVDADRPAYRTTTPGSYSEQPEVSSDLEDFEANEPADTDAVVEKSVKSKKK
ncbi:MAG: hypothetical protein M0R32_06415 [Candidatus Cloacimonetes bacterium]|jgi:hypothetical protein|nr:hypothetical protein [Candidatus Cloacimonadota bacterium]